MLTTRRRFLGNTYEEINVWLFCIAWPLRSIAMLIWILSLRRKTRALRHVFLIANNPSIARHRQREH